MLHRSNDSPFDTYVAELASLVIEQRWDWREDSDNVLANYSVYVPPRACAAAAATGKAGVFLAPSATTGTLVATGRAGRLVASVSPWTMEAGTEKGAGSSVQLISCMAHRVPLVFDGPSNGSILASGDGASWACDEDRGSARDVHDYTHDIPSNCEFSSNDDHVICRVTVDVIVTAADTPKWAAGAATNHSPVEYCSL
jgi:hypothetical protein